ncbi:cell wall-binding repeat-containing protein [Lagierella sp.]|uniref:cell wall-binding repeat-containing protein n=1 Tax=Lagierella sp. TaxID=2849657 RepID=UPI00260B1D99|nr:cell wall-binding repeat-containing protein [Lagierella sp.]
MKNKIIGLLTIFCLLILPSTSLAKGKVYLYRISEKSRFGTSVETSKVAYKKTINAVLVSGDNFADGLAGGVLGSVLNGPVLLTNKDKVPQVVLDELKRLQVKNVYIVGGNSSVSDKVIKELSNYKVKRIKGKNRIETASNVAIYIKNSGLPYDKRYFALANGNVFADSLSVSGYLATTRIPLLLTNGKDMEKSNLDYVSLAKSTKAILVGGNSSVNPSILSNNDLLKNIDKTIFSGRDRYLTSLEVAKKGFNDVRTVILVSGEDFPDALSASNVAKYVSGPILLTSSTGINKDIVDYIKGGDITRLIVVGGSNRVPNKLLEVINKDQIRGPEEIGNPNEDPVG